MDERQEIERHDSWCQWVEEERAEIERDCERLREHEAYRRWVEYEKEQIHGPEKKKKGRREVETHWADPNLPENVEWATLGFAKINDMELGNKDVSFFDVVRKRETGQKNARVGVTHVAELWDLLK